MFRRRGRLSRVALSCAIAIGVGSGTHAQQDAGDLQIRTLKVQGNVYMLAGGGANVAVQVGDEGVLVVDTNLAPMAPRILEAIRRISDKPVLWVINTHIHPDHIGGNEALPRLGGAAAAGQRVRVIAHENVLNRMTASTDPPYPREMWPNDEYHTAQKDMSFNGEAIVIEHMPKAHTDGDSIVHFRKSDVLIVGGLFAPGRYPAIDLANGGSLQGLIDALNRILKITVPLKYQEGGTYVIPGHGRLCDEADVVEYRDMLTIIRDRVQDLIAKGMTLEQVKAARPTRDYDTEYGVTTGTWTTEMFVEAVYRSLTQKN
jgi:cyclase